MAWVAKVAAASRTNTPNTTPSRPGADRGRRSRSSSAAFGSVMGPGSLNDLAARAEGPNGRCVGQLWRASSWPPPTPQPHLFSPASCAFSQLTPTCFYRASSKCCFDYHWNQRLRTDCWQASNCPSARVPTMLPLSLMMMLTLLSASLHTDQLHTLRSESIHIPLRHLLAGSVNGLHHPGLGTRRTRQPPPFRHNRQLHPIWSAQAVERR